MAKQNAIALKAAASMLSNAEPSGSKLNPNDSSYNGEIQVVFNWYSAEKTKVDAYKYLLEYVKKNRNKDYKAFQKINENKVVTTIGWLARLVNRGALISEDHRSRLEQHIDLLLSTESLKEYVADAVEKEKKVVVNIQDAIKQRAKEYIGELEGAIDEFILEDKEFSLYNDFKSRQIPAPYVQDIKTWAEGKLQEFTEVSESKDSQLIEGYSNINKRKLKALLKLFDQFIQDCDLYGQFKKANRKPRAVKEKPAAQQVKSIKYKIRDDEFGIDSERPIDVVGAQQVWLFNTKTRKLAVYTSESTKGILVKGTTLQNWEPEKSKQKTLRKPQDQIKDLMSSGKVKLRTFMDSIKSKEQAVNGRINIDTVILKILR